MKPQTQPSSKVAVQVSLTNFFSDESMPKHDGYYGDAAHLMKAKRRARDRKLIKYPELCKLVIERLKNGWTPEQIGNRLAHDEEPLRVCHALPSRVLRSNVPSGKRFIGTSIRRKAWRMSSGGIYRYIERTAHRVVLESAGNLVFAVMSASCFVLKMLHIVVSSGTGKVI